MVPKYSCVLAVAGQLTLVTVWSPSLTLGVHCVNGLNGVVQSCMVAVGA
jgi:hypothetical protein